MTLQRNLDDRWLSGVCAGIADQSQLPVWLVRIAWILLTPISVGLSIIVYLVMALSLPAAQSQPETEGKSDGKETQQ